MSEGGGPAALRGFRLQTLFALSKILKETNTFFRLEGAEDLEAIDRDGNPTEFIQVKSHTAPLRLSHLRSKTGKGYPFFKRVLDRCGAYPEAKQILLSFGPIGPEIQKAWEKECPDRKRVAKKLTETFSETEVQLLFATLSIEEEHESTCKSTVYEALRETLAGGEPNHAFEILSFWLNQQSEAQAIIEKATVLKKLDGIGQYLAWRATHHRELYTSIHPIQAGGETALDTDRLREEFYQGIAARFEHIVSGASIPRTDKICEIANSFKQSRIVVIHGASGQGKSTLAYQYINEYIPSPLRFEVRRIQDLQHAQSIATALEHLKAIEAPMLVYLDVQPRDLEWMEIVNSLSRSPDIHLLVTIREEDWARASAVAWPQFREIELALDQQEAHLIYRRLQSRLVSSNILNFEDAWRRFGESGPLLEFVFLVTQSQKLKERLRQQVDTLETELTANELAFLRSAVVASSYAARLDLRKLIETIGLSKPMRVLRRLEKEYLLRTTDEGKLVEGLHPLRSEILADLLTDAVISPWTEAARTALRSMTERDLETFLFYAFSRQRPHRQFILDCLESSRPETWSGFAGVLRPLLWLDLAGYYDENVLVLNVAYDYFKGAWMMLPPWDVVNLASLNASLYEKGLEDILPEFEDPVLDIRTRRVREHASFAHARSWLLSQKSAPACPTDGVDWQAAAEVIFWVGFWDLEIKCQEWLSEFDLELAVESQPIEVSADLIRALSFLNAEAFQTKIHKAQPLAAKSYLKAYDVLEIVDDGQKAVAHFVVNLETFEDGEHPRPETEPLEVEEDRLHLEAMRRIDVLRKIFPSRSTIGSQGYGAHLELLEAPFDSSHKQVEAKMLLPQWAVHLNGVFHRLVNYARRPPTWKSYCDSVIELRQDNVEMLRSLCEGITLYFRSRPLVPVLGTSIDEASWRGLQKRLAELPELPKVAVDEWGISTEDTGQEHSSNNVGFLKRESLALRKYTPYTKAFRNFMSALSNFYNKALLVLSSNPHIGRSAGHHRSQEALERAFSEAGVTAHVRRLTVFNIQNALQNLRPMQKKFRNHFIHIVGNEQLELLEDDEREQIRMIWTLWWHFTNKPESIFDDPAMQIVHRVQSMRQRRLQQLKKKLRKLGKSRSSKFQIRDDLQWAEKPALWITCDIEDLLLKGELLDGSLRIASTVLTSKRKGSLLSSILSLFWPQVLLVFTYFGRGLRAEALCVKTTVLELGNSLLSGEKWRYETVELPQEVCRDIDLGLWKHSRIELLTELKKRFVQSALVLSWLRDLCKLPDGESPYENKDLLRSIYEDKMGPALGRSLERFLSVSKTTLDEFDLLSEDSQTGRSILAEACDLLADLRNLFLRYCDEEGKIDKLTREQLKELADGWLEAFGSLEAIELGFIADLFDERMLPT